MPCPNDEMLSMYMDKTLEPPAADALARHVATCERCSQTVHQWETVQQAVGEVWLRHQTGSPDASTASTCPPQAALVDAVSGLLTPQERADLDAHLRDCDACLVQMRALRRTVRLLRQERWLTPPEPLRRIARSAIVGSAARSGIREITRVVIEVAQRGLKVLEASWGAATLDLQIMPLSAPVPVLRAQEGAGEGEQAVAIRHLAGDITLYITLIPEAHNTVRLSLRAHKQNAPLAQALVTVRREQRTVYARRLSVAGEMPVFRLTAGEYTISLAQEGVEMTVVLQTVPAS
jgi:anti-sigma factor RsiW